jgi:hypothetical protein
MLEAETSSALHKEAGDVWEGWSSRAAIGWGLNFELYLCRYPHSPDRAARVAVKNERYPNVDEIRLNHPLEGGACLRLRHRGAMPLRVGRRFNGGGEPKNPEGYGSLGAPCAHAWSEANRWKWPRSAMSSSRVPFSTILP